MSFVLPPSVDRVFPLCYFSSLPFFTVCFLYIIYLPFKIFTECFLYIVCLTLQSLPCSLYMIKLPSQSLPYPPFISFILPSFLLLPWRLLVRRMFGNSFYNTRVGTRSRKGVNKKRSAACCSHDRKYYRMAEREVNIRWRGDLIHSG